MDNSKKITILSRYAKDRLFDPKKHFTDEKIGGPAFFLTKVFDRDKIEYDLKLASQVVVDILINSEGEFGRIKMQISPVKVNFKSINTPYMVISTILDDFSLANLNDYKGKVFFDVQGYVREGDNFGQKKVWNPSEKISKSIYSLKGTEEELSYVNSEFIEKQKRKVLISTKGKLGCDIFIAGEKYQLKPHQIVETKDAIGAGDTFFGNFISNFIQTNDLILSVTNSIPATSKFLQEKQQEKVYPV